MSSLRPVLDIRVIWVLIARLRVRVPMNYWFESESQQDYFLVWPLTSHTKQWRSKPVEKCQALSTFQPDLWQILIGFVTPNK